MNKTAIALAVLVAAVVAGAYFLLSDRTDGPQPPEAGPGVALTGNGRTAGIDAIGSGAAPDGASSRGAPAAGLGVRSEAFPKSEQAGTAAVSGRVVEADGDKPVAAARAALMDGAGFVVAETESRADGEFRIDNVRAAAGARVRVIAAGFAAQVTAAFEVKDDESKRIPDVRLERGEPLRGRMVDLEGKAVEGAEARLYRQGAGEDSEEEDFNFFTIFSRIFDEGPPAEIARTDRDGGFEFPSASPGSYVVGAVAKGLQARYSDPVAVHRGAASPGVDFKLAPGRRVSGTVTGDAGAPVAGALIAAHESEPGHVGSMRTQKARTDAAGKFAFDSLGAGDIHLVVRAEGYAMQIARVPHAGTAPSDVKLKRGCRVHGRITDAADDRGLAGVHLMVMSPTSESGMGLAESDATGRYVIESAAPADDALLIVQVKGYTVAQAAPDPSDKQKFMMPNSISLGALQGGGDVEKNLALTGGATVEGTVVDAADGKPIEGAKVRVVPDRQFGFGDGGALVAASKADGTFSISPVPPGKITITASREGYLDSLADAPGDAAPEPQQEDDVVVNRRVVDPRPEVRAGQKLAGKTLKLSRGASADGAVVDEAGAPVAGARVAWVASARDPAAFMRWRSVVPPPPQTTDAAGKFKLTGLPEGDVTVSATHPAHAAGGRQDVAIGANTPPIKIVVSKGGVVLGRMLHPDGTPAAGMHVDLSGFARVVVGEAARGFGGPSAFSCQTDAQGRFRFEGVPYGEGRIELSMWNEFQEARDEADSAGGSEPHQVMFNGRARKWLLDPAETEVVCAAGKPCDKTLRLIAPQSIEGRVVYDDGTPGANVAITTTRGGGGDRSRPADGAQAWAQSDAQGAFKLEGLAPGAYEVTAQVWSAEGAEAGEVVTAYPPLDHNLPSRGMTLKNVAAGSKGLVLRIAKPRAPAPTEPKDGADK